MSDSVLCHFHQKPAEWVCDGCLKQYGSCCVPTPPENADSPLCVLCEAELRFVGAANKATPFWLKINDFFLYPLNPGSLGFLLVCSALTVVTPYAGIAALPLSILLLCAMTKYSLQVIERVSEGEWAPPTLLEGFSGEGFNLFFKQMGIFILIGVMLFFVSKLNSLVVLLGAGAFFLLALPASMMILARERSVFAAVSPFRLTFVIASIGWPYLLLYFFLMILYGAPGYFFGSQQGSEPSGFFMGASLLLTGYFSLVMCSMMGYCLFQYQDALGYVADIDQDNRPTEKEYSVQKALADSIVLLREGREAEALTRLRGVLAEQPENAELLRRYHQLLVMAGDESELLAFTRKYSRRLLILGKDYDAADAYLAVRQKVASYLPEEPGDRYRLALALSKTGKPREAIRLLHNMHRLFPGYQGLPEAYLLAARVFSEGLDDDHRALQLLGYLCRRFPEHKLIAEIKELQEVLGSLAHA